MSLFITIYSSHFFSSVYFSLLCFNSIQGVLKNKNNKQTRLTAVSFFYCTHNSQQHTRVIYIGDQDTLHTRRPEVAVNFCSAFNPSRIVPPPGSSRSSGQLLSARGPIEPSVSVRDGQDCSVLFACFSVGVISGGNPLWTRGEHANSTQKGPGDSTEGLRRTCPPEPTAPHAGIEPMTFLLWGGSASTWATVPPVSSHQSTSLWSFHTKRPPLCVFTAAPMQWVSAIRYISMAWPQSNYGP